MFGGRPFGSHPYGGYVSPVSVADTAFAEFLALATAKRQWLLELDAVSLAPTGGSSRMFGGAPLGAHPFGGHTPGSGIAPATAFYFSSHGFNSLEADTPALIHYEPRLAAGVTVERRITGRDGIGGLTRVLAEVRLVNVDGGLDSLATDYALDGQRATLLVGPVHEAPDAEAPSREEFGVVFAGVVSRVSGTLEVVTLSLSDGVARLDRNVNESTYAGTGALEGGDDLQGRNKPKAFGFCRNVPAPLVDDVKLIHQVHDGLANDVPACRDRGVALTRGADYGSVADLNSTAPSAGQYRVLLHASGSYARLGATPAGTVTFDIEGDASGAGYTEVRGDIILRLLAPVLTTSDIDTTSFIRFNAASPAAANLWLGTEPRSIGSAVDELLDDAGACGGFTARGAFAVQLIELREAEPPAAEFAKETNILSIECQSLPSPVDPIVWRALVGWGRNYTMQNDVAAGATAAVRNFAGKDLRVVDAQSAAIQARHPLARELGPGAGLYTHKSEADVESVRRFDLWSIPPRRLRLMTPPEGMPRELGDAVWLSYPRYGLDYGARGIVIESVIRDMTVELGVLARC